MKKFCSITTSFRMVKYLLILVGFVSSHSTGNESVKERVYRSVSSDIKYLLDGMQSQLKFVTESLDTVKKMCDHQKTSKKGFVAFSARTSKQLTSTAASIKVVFDHIVTNIGKAYNSATGIFTAQSDGVYVFAWTILTNPKKWFDSELVVNGTPKLYNAADAQHGGSYESSGCTGVIELKSGDKVWIRKYSNYGNLLREHWSSFSGWKLL